MPDRLILQDLAVECRLGVPDWEREKPQTVWVDVELAIDAAKAARRDDMADAVDYAELAARISRHVRRKPYRLLETLADEIAALVLREGAVPSVRVRVKKRALPGMDYAAVEVARSRARVRAVRERRARLSRR
jgi:dihydroneopterin aldolase